MRSGYSDRSLVEKLGLRAGMTVYLGHPPEHIDLLPDTVVFSTRVAWPKRASKVPTDVTEDVVREVALPLGLVDVKVAAIDDTWSGLKLLIRRENR